MTKRYATRFLALTLLLVPSAGLAWGNAGHRIVAAVAAQQLNPAIAAQANALLGGHTLVEVSTLPDTWRDQRPQTAPWHFVNIPLAADTYDPARDCQNANCLLGALDHFGAVLRNPSQPAGARAQALIYITHLVGDLHQPLHCADNNDRGGNAVQVAFLGAPTNLHHVWDTDLIAARHLSEPEYVQHLLTDTLGNQDPALLATGTFVAWANAAHLLGRRAYDLPADHALDATYVQATLPVVDAQLLLAGLRLAHAISVALTQPATQTYSEQLLQMSRAGAQQQVFEGCRIEGDSKGDPRLNVLKNRTTPPNVYHPSTIEGFANTHPAAEAMGKRPRHEWTNPALQSVYPAEAQGATIIGYLLDHKHEAPESCNCHSPSDRDYHLWLATQPTDAKSHSIVVEISPREVPNHPGWTEANLKHLVDTHTQVRIGGWVLWDQEHPEQLHDRTDKNGRVTKASRSTLWEIHPIHTIEVRTGSGWTDLDKMNQ